MNVDFDTPRDIVLVQQVKKKLSCVNVTQLIDSPDTKTVVAITEPLGTITLWSGSAYDAIGQWTDYDVKKRINQLY